MSKNPHSRPPSAANNPRSGHDVHAVTDVCLPDMVKFAAGSVRWQLARSHCYPTVFL